VATQHNNVIFDPHLHFFYLEQGDYHWLKAGLPAWPNIALIQKSFSHRDLLLEDQFKLANYSHVESGFDNQDASHEVRFLEQENGCDHCAIAGVQIDQDPIEFKHQINQLLAYKTFVGIRDITEGIEAKRLLHKNVLKNLAYLAVNKLIFEAQFELSQLTITEHLCQLAKSLPHLSIVINHAGLVNADTFEKWHIGLLEIAKYKNISTKYSGFEMLNLSLDDPFRQVIFSTLVEALGDKRIIFASNFPVCLMASSYLSLWQTYYSYCQSEQQWQQLSFQNAIDLYNQ
jgi:predicted TIM-barrel fold metal-dependent hydrolase